MTEKTAILFCVGRELLEGHVLDRNAHFMATHLSQIGVRVRTIQVLDDVEAEIVAAIRHAASLQPSYILMTGGMGPGPQDLTRAAAAKAVDLPLIADDRAREFVTNSYRRWLAKGIVDNAEVGEDRVALTYVPKGATAFENMSGTAPALAFQKDGVKYFLLPGQPEELRQLFTEHVKPAIAAESTRDFRDQIHIDFPGGDESLLPRLLGDLGRRHPQVQSRSRSLSGERGTGIRITLTVEGTNREELTRELDDAAADLRARLGLEFSDTRTGRSIAANGE
jgi:nicotinamide-nucleotide amidase